MKYLLVAVILSGLTLPLLTNAQFSSPLGRSFGGKILTVVPCTCSFSLMINVGSPKGGTFIYIPGLSTIYKYYGLWPGNWALGTAFGRAQCLTGFPPACVNVGTGSIIRMIGTSLF